MNPLHEPDRGPIAGGHADLPRVQPRRGPGVGLEAGLDGDVEIGGAALLHPDLLFSEVVREPSLGRGALETFAITFDQRNLRVRLQPGVAAE